LVETRREVLLAWPQHAAVLGLKAFRMGPQSVVALDFSAWGANIDLNDMTSRLRQALTQLKSSLG
jgi:hypothetical protein